MKKLIILMACACCLLTARAQTGNISLYVYVPEQTENLPEGSAQYLANSLCNAVTTDGLAAQDDYVTQFLLVPKINMLQKNILANTQQQFVMTFSMTLQVLDSKSGTIYSSKAVELKGVGNNETKAYNSAFQALNGQNRQISELVAEAKAKIIAYYDAEAASIIKRAKVLASQRKYEEAFYLLSMIPSQCARYDKACDASIELWGKYEDYACGKNLAKAQAAWAAGADAKAAEQAAEYLSRILPGSKCYGDAKRLAGEIKAKQGEVWKLEQTMYSDEHELNMAKIKAVQEIGVAYGKGQQPALVINKKQSKSLY